jgi:putative acetyltransferase
MLIRQEIESDFDKVYDLNVAAFPTAAEAVLVNALRERADPVVSLVAQEADVVGHILFSPVSLSGNTELTIMGLAPMAVAPGRQNEGVGSELVLAGLDCCKTIGVSAVVVLGHPNYYPRFGFLPSARFGIDSEYKVPAEVFMVMELIPGALSECEGRVKYHAAFSDL